VIAQHVLMREVGSDLLEGRIKLTSCLRNINGAAGLAGELFHAPLGRERAQVCAIVESGLHYKDLTVVSEHALDGGFKIVAAGSLHPVRNYHQHASAIVRTKISRGIDDCIEERSG